MIQFLAHHVSNFWGHTWINHSPCLHTSPRNVAWQCGIWSQIRSIKNCLDIDSLKTTVQALCILHLDYNNALLYGLPTKEINCLQQVQNSCAKLVLGKNRYDSSMACLKQLHWLPVRFQIRFKILCIMHRVDNNAAPVYLHNMVNKKFFHRQTRCATTPGLLYVIPSIERKTFQARAFSVSGPTEWNNLPKPPKNHYRP